jgi:hypothetical protein
MTERFFRAFRGGGLDLSVPVTTQPKQQIKREVTMGSNTPAVRGVLCVDEEKLKGRVDEVVRSSVEEALNAWRGNR